MKKAKILIATIAMILGFAIISGNIQTASAAKNYKTIPTSLRGKWQSHRDKSGYSTYLKITKHSLYYSSFRYGKKLNGHGTIKGKFTVQKIKSYKGYWSIAKGGASWGLKSTKIKYKGHKIKVLKSLQRNYAKQSNFTVNFYKK